MSYVSPYIRFGLENLIEEIAFHFRTEVALEAYSPTAVVKAGHFEFAGHVNNSVDLFRTYSVTDFENLSLRYHLITVLLTLTNAFDVPLLGLIK